MSWTGEFVAVSTGGAVVRGEATAVFQRVVIDSRVVQAGDLFVALTGRRFDSHAFLAQVAAAGAAGAIVQTGRAADAAGLPWVLEIPDPVQALGELARAHRRTLTAPVVAITGSSGKTTTKEMLAFILRDAREIVATLGTQNNHIGVPLTLLRSAPSDEAVIVEVGTNHFGELAALGGITAPTITVITNIGPAHLEFFGSLEGVARAKWELVQAMGPSGVAVLNHDDPYLREAARQWPGRVVWFGTDRRAEFWIEQVTEEPWGIRALVNRRYPLRLPLPGRHHLLDAAAAVACAQLVGIDPAEATQALASFMPARGRLERQIVGGVRFINDTYNANPASARTAVEALLQWAGPSRRFVVFGDMRELGAEEARYHAELGVWLGQLPIDGLLTLGPLARHLQTAACESGLRRGWHCESLDDMSERLSTMVQPGDVVLVKGSRAMRMEKVVQCFMSSSSR